MGETTYQAVPGFFLHDTPTTQETPAVPPRFGLLDDSPTCWTNLFDRIAQLNNDSKRKDISYKVIFFGRHGEGYHNVAWNKYGREAWDDHWSKLRGDGEITWGPDPVLTPLGEEQAEAAHQRWKSEIAAGLPLPGKLYCSPFSRALRTYEISFNGLLPKGTSTIVLENCREEHGVHTCDKRNTRSYIESTFKRIGIEFENGFTEEDELWVPEVRESLSHVAQRAKKVLDVIFDCDATFVSVTCHSGIINGFRRAIGLQYFDPELPTGGIYPVVVRALHTF